MAGNNAIQFLRGNSTARRASNQSLEAGQPFYETDTNLLYVGGESGTALNTAVPVGGISLYRHDISIVAQGVSGLSAGCTIRLTVYNDSSSEYSEDDITGKYAVTGSAVVLYPMGPGGSGSGTDTAGYYYFDVLTADFGKGIKKQDLNLTAVFTPYFIAISGSVTFTARPTFPELKTVPILTVTSPAPKISFTDNVTKIL